MNSYNIPAYDLLINPQIPKLATPREIFLLVIKEDNGRARNNIQILNPLDYIACLANYTLFFLLQMNVLYVIFPEQWNEQPELIQAE